jgi:hypothetical protein
MPERGSQGRDRLGTARINMAVEVRSCEDGLDMTRQSWEGRVLQANVDSGSGWQWE